MDDFPFVPGWHDYPEDGIAIQSMQPIGTFEDSPAGQQSDPLPDLVSLHDAAVKVTGSYLPGRDQGQAGTCEGFANIRAVELSMLVAIARGANFLWDNVGLAIEPGYGYSRVEIGKRKLGRGDGSYGAWMAQALKDLGVTFRKKFPDLGIDLSEYSIALARDWGYNGVPDNLEPILRQHPVRAISKITTIDGLKRALAAGYGVAEGSCYLLNRNRNSQGIIDAYYGGPRSGHCQSIVGYIVIGGVTYFCWDNQWGKYHGGPTHPKFPCPAGGLVHESWTQKALDAGDTWAFSDVVGFPQRDYLDWGSIG